MEKKYSEIQLTKNKMYANNRKIKKSSTLPRAINVIDLNIKMLEKYIFIYYSRTNFNNFSDNNKIYFIKLEKNNQN